MGTDFSLNGVLFILGIIAALSTSLDKVNSSGGVDPLGMFMPDTVSIYMMDK